MRSIWWFPLLVTACASSGLVDTAYHGDLQALKAEIAAARASGDLDADAARELGRAVIARELASSSGPAAGERVDLLRPCAGELVAELTDRAERPDAGGARALALLLDLGQLDPAPLVERYATAEESAFRAVAARAAVGLRHTALRHQYFVDIDAAVRRAAFEAARIVASPRDLELLLEAARLDPDDLARSRAVLAVGAIGGQRAVLGLADLWEGSGEADRLVLIEAWAMEPTLRTGGRDRLVRVIEAGAGLPRVAAAAALVRAGAEPTSLARQVIVRAVSKGATDERRLGIVTVPLDPEGVEALRAAAADPDRLVRVLAAARLSERPEGRDGVIKKLRALGEGDDEAAAQARRALGVLGDSTVGDRLERELGSPAARARRSAARSLIRLGRPERVAPLLADEDVTVRLGVACDLLSSS